MFENKIKKKKKTHEKLLLIFWSSLSKKGKSWNFSQSLLSLLSSKK